MSTFNTRNTPLLSAADGFQQEALDFGVGATLLSDLFTIPNNANSAWLQVADTQFLRFRIDGSTVGAEWMTLPGLAVLPLTNRQELLNLVLASALGTVDVSVQFFEGALGPMPPAPQVPGTSGGAPGPPGPPGPPGSLSSLPTENVVHVMKNGNDGSGTRNRLDLPFLTITAGAAVLQPGDTLVIWPGTYNEGDIPLGNCSVLNMGATVEAPIGSGSLFNFNIAGSITNIAGTGTFSSLQGPILLLNEANVVVSAACDYWISVGSIALDNFGGGILVIHGAFITSGGDAAFNGDYFQITSFGVVTTASGAAFRMRSPGNWQHTGPVNGADVLIDIADGSLIIFGDVSSTGGSVVSSQGGSLRVHGNITTNAAAPTPAINSTTSTIQVFGDITANGPAIVDVGSFIQVRGNSLTVSRTLEVDNTRLEWYGKLQSAASTGVVSVINGSTVTISGEITSSSGSAASIALDVDASACILVGNIISATGTCARASNNSQLGITGNVATTAGEGILLQTGSSVELRGNASSTGDSAIRNNGGTLLALGNLSTTGPSQSDYGLWHLAGTSTVFGNCSANGGSGAKCEGGSATIYGMCSSIGRYGVYQIGGEMTCNGEVISFANQHSAWMQGLTGGRLRLNGRVTGTAASFAPVVISSAGGGTLELGGACYIDTTFTYSIADEPTNSGGTVRSYGAYSNKIQYPTVVIDGQLNVLP